MNEGWVKLHRKILDNPSICKDTDHFSVWIYLLLNATHEDKKVRFGGEEITLLPGQLLTSRSEISKVLKIDTNKVYRVLSFFEKEQQIEQITDRQKTLVTIMNWGTYQTGSEQRNEQRNEQRKNRLKPLSLLGIWALAKQKVHNEMHNEMHNEKKVSFISPDKRFPPHPLLKLTSFKLSKPYKKNKRSINTHLNRAHTHEEGPKKVKAYGTYKNVLLEEAWLAVFKAQYGEKFTQSLIDRFSAYKQGKGIENANDCVFLEKWAVEDQQDTKLSSFDTDEFFELALAKSEAQINKRRCKNEA